MLNRGEEIIDVRVPDRALTPDEIKEYNLRSNKNLGEWDFDLLANFGEEMLMDVGFESQELDLVFGLERIEDFDVNKELENLHVFMDEFPGLLNYVSISIRMSVAMATALG